MDLELADNLSAAVFRLHQCTIFIGDERSWREGVVICHTHTRFFAREGGGGGGCNKVTWNVPLDGIVFSQVD